MVKILLSGALGAAFALYAVAGPATAATITVTPDNIGAAFAAAKGGDTLRLVGTFGGARLANESFSKLVTLDASRAMFTGTLQINNVSNVKVYGGTFNIAGNGLYAKAATIYSGSNVWFDRTTVVGGAGQYGVWFQGTNNAQVSAGRFSGLRAGVLFGAVTNGLATKNKFTAADSDGIDISDSHGVTASYNSCSAGNPGPGVHADCIQLWSVAGNPLQSDITVTRNSATGPTQGFTSFSTGGGGLRIQITNNVVNTSASQGIACLDCYDSIISNNRVSTLPGSAHKTNLNVLGGGGNTVTGNIVEAYSGVRLSAVGGFAADDMVRSFAADDFVRSFDDRGAVAPDMAAGRFAVADGIPAAIPEPSTWAMLLIGFGAVGAVARRRAVHA